VYARVATFEGGDPGQFDEMAAQMQASGRPDGVPATGFLFLVDRGSGRSLGITLFETEDDLRAGNEAMNAMTPPTTGAMGHRVSVETYEVPFQMT
jgi:hypothetical protein